MPREKPDALWRAIHDSLNADIAAARYAPGDKLPTEAALAARFGVNRHTVRRALGELAEAGVIFTRRGAGAFVAHRPTDYPIGARVHVYDGLSLADGMPVATFRSSFPAARFPDLLQALRRLKSVTEALREQGIADYTRASTRLTAKLASPTQALHLHLNPGAPILRTTAVNVDPDGQPIEYGRTWFAGDRITLTLSDL